MSGTWPGDCCMGVVARVFRADMDDTCRCSWTVVSAFRRKHSAAHAQDMHHISPFIVYVVASAFRRKHSVAHAQDVQDTSPFIVWLVASAFRRKNSTATRHGPHVSA